MATKRSASPGTRTSRGVCSPMQSPFGGSMSTAASGGINGRNKAPFDTPQGMGGQSIPTRFYDAMPARSATTSTAGQVSPPIGRTQNVGERRFKNPR